MKKFISLLLVCLMIVTGFCMNIQAEESSALVNITIADENGNIAVANEATAVSDADKDGALTINDALLVIHEKYNKEFKTAESSYGLSITELWGVENGGSYGYYLNNASAWSLMDTVKDGDNLTAFIYQDLVTWSDKYSFFDVTNAEIASGETVTLTLNEVVFDSNYTPSNQPVADAAITIDGNATELKTNSNGIVTVPVSAGKHVISATSETEVLVPAVCVVTASTNDTADVYVTISDGTGSLPMAFEKVTVSDIDKDGALTINDALYCAHDKSYKGGAAAGYASAETAYGLSLTKLWGIENGGSYGYYVNNKSAYSLADTVKDNDVINAFVYTDLTTWSDKYCYFDASVYLIEGSDSVTVILSYAGYDENYAPVVYPVAGAAIVINGTKTDIVTDDNGSATIKVTQEGTYTLSAVSDTMTLVPPYAAVTFTQVPEETENTSAATTAEETTSAPTAKKGCFSMTGSVVVILASAAVAGVAIVKKKHE